MILITWKTYTVRREIKSIWGKWSKEDSWWIIDNTMESVKAFSEKHPELEIEEIENKEIQTLPKIDYQIQRAEKKIEMYSNRAWKAQKDFEYLEERHSTLTHWHDYAFITQPCNGHRWMINAKNKVEKVMEKKYWEWGAMDREKQANSKLDYWTAELKRLQDKKAWKWLNAEAKRNLLIKEHKEKIKVWDKVKCHLIQEGFWIVKKMNTKTCKLEWYSFNIWLQWVYPS